MGESARDSGLNETSGNGRTGKSLGVVDALAGPGLGDSRRQDGQPGGTGRGLLFEFAHKGRVDVGRGEDADGRSGQTVLARGEHGVEARVVAWHFVDALCGPPDTVNTDSLDAVRRRKPKGQKKIPNSQNRRNVLLARNDSVRKISPRMSINKMQCTLMGQVKLTKYQFKVPA